MSKDGQLVTYIEHGGGSRPASIVEKYGPKALRYGSMVGGVRRRSVVDPSAAAPPCGTVTQRDQHFSSVVSANANFPDMHTEAREHVEVEAKMGLWQGMKTYPQAAAWSILLSSTVIMEGYDTSLIGSLFAYPAFAHKYGGVLIDGKWQIPTAWQTGLQNGKHRTESCFCEISADQLQARLSVRLLASLPMASFATDLATRRSWSSL